MVCSGVDLGVGRANQCTRFKTTEAWSSRGATKHEALKNTTEARWDTEVPTAFLCVVRVSVVFDRTEKSCSKCVILPFCTAKRTERENARWPAKRAK